MTVLSLFDGISCGMVALKRVNIPIEKYVAYEIDKYAIQNCLHIKSFERLSRLKDNKNLIKLCFYFIFFAMVNCNL